MWKLRRAAPIALAAVVHTTLPGSIVMMPRVCCAQPKQQDLIARGRSLFEDQQYEESIQTLSAALLRPNLAKEQKIEVYRLMALNFITLNRKDEAESAVRGLLALDASYELPKNESPRFRNFFAAARKKWEEDGRPGQQAENAPPPAAVTMQHTSPSQVQPKTDIPLSIKLDDPQGRVYDVKLFYRSGSTGKFLEIATPINAGAGKATIPGAAVKPPLVEYYFEGFDKGGLPIVSRGDAAAPLRVAVPEPTKGWVLPVAIGGGVVVAVGATLAIMAAAGVFSPPKATVSTSIYEQ
jgi:hypothetical protein